MTELVETGLSRRPAGRRRAHLPTRIGASIACAATVICCGGVGVGAAGRCPRSSPARSRTSAAAPARRARPRPAASVSRTWLSSTARRWALKSRPSRGTLPCTAATVIDWVVGGARAGVPDLRPDQRGGQQHDGDAGAGQHDRGRRRCRRCRRGATSARSPGAMAARLNPISATANDSSGAPPTCATASSGPSVWPKATTPHGNPPNGTVRLQPLLGRPQPGEPQRPAGQPAHRDREQTEHRREHRLQHRERQPRHGTDQSADPRQQRDVERQPEQEPVAESAGKRGRFAGEHPGQQRERDDRQVPPAERREAHAQQQTGDDRDAQLRQTGHDGLAEPLGARRATGRRLSAGGRRRRRVALARRGPGRRFVVCAAAADSVLAMDDDTSVHGLPAARQRDPGPSRGSAGTRERGSVDQRCTRPPGRPGALTSNSSASQTA